MPLSSERSPDGSNRVHPGHGDQSGLRDYVVVWLRPERNEAVALEQLLLFRAGAEQRPSLRRIGSGAGDGPLPLAEPGGARRADAASLWPDPGYGVKGAK